MARILNQRVHHRPKCEVLKGELYLELPGKVKFNIFEFHTARKHIIPMMFEEMQKLTDKDVLKLLKDKQTSTIKGYTLCIATPHSGTLMRRMQWLLKQVVAKYPQANIILKAPWHSLLRMYTYSNEKTELIEVAC